MQARRGRGSRDDPAPPPAIAYVIHPSADVGKASPGNGVGAKRAGGDVEITGVAVGAVPKEQTNPIASQSSLEIALENKA